MSGKCEGCLKITTADETIISCKECKNGYHAPCVDLTRAFVRSRAANAWLCPACITSRKRSTVGDNTSTPIRGNAVAPVEQMDRTFDMEKDIRREKEDQADMSVLVTEMRAFRTQLSSMQQELREFMVSLEMCHGRLDDLDKRLDGYDRRLLAVEQQREETAALRRTVADLKEEVADRDRQALLNDVKICGLPESRGENLHHIACVVAQKIGMQIDEREIVSVERTGAPPQPPRPVTASAAADSSERRQHRPIVVRLVRREVRDGMLKAARERRGVMAADVVEVGGQSRIFVNEHLTRENAKLFRQARADLRDMCKYVWTREGLVYARTRDGAPRRRLRNEMDIAALLQPPTNFPANNASDGGGGGATPANCNKPSLL